MTDHLDGAEFQARLQRLDALLQDVERLADPAARAQVGEVVQALLDLHHAGLESILERLEAAGQPGAAVLDACARDDQAGGMLLLHGLHPFSLEERVLQALEQVRPALKSHGMEYDSSFTRRGITWPTKSTPRSTGCRIVLDSLSLRSRCSGSQSAIAWCAAFSQRGSECSSTMSST